MAEMRFNCPQCQQEIACDELWGGHQIQCPTCQAEISVPQAQAPAAAAANPLVPKPPAGNQAFGGPHPGSTLRRRPGRAGQTTRGAEGEEEKIPSSKS